MPNPSGAPSSQEAEDVLVVALQSAAAADGNGAYASVAGYSGPITVELTNSGTGTTSANLEGSFDGSTWYAIGFFQIDATAALVRSVSAISVTASTFAHVYSILDTYNLIRCRLSGSSGTPSVNATLRANPV